MNNFLTQETPSKVMALLGAALFSLALMFTTTATGASFNGVESGSNIVAYDVFAPSSVVALVDNTASGYSKFLTAYLFNPAEESYALAADNIAFIATNAMDQIAMTTGIGQHASVPTVAGASVRALQSSQ